MTPLSLFLKISRVGDSTTCLGSEFHRRMVSGKKEPFSKLVRVYGTRSLRLFPLVDEVAGISWLSGMSVSLLMIRYIIVTLEMALRCCRGSQPRLQSMVLTLLSLE